MKCATSECGGTDQWHPVLQLHAPAKFGNAPFIPCILGLVLCEFCMSRAKPEHFNSPELQELMERITVGMGFVKPDFGRTTLGRAPLKGDDGKPLLPEEP
mgnify:CR=1 FL=1